MREELYIYGSDGERKKIDLNNPSGITLKWVSNIFNSLDKVNCSYSYTFKIPMTRNNREALEFAEDIRHTSTLLGKKLKAEFVQDGIPLFSKANLYIDKVSSKSYSCVLTWGLVEGLENLKDEGVSLCELRDALVAAGVSNDELADDGMADWGMIDSVGRFSNAKKVLYPMYNAGVPFSKVCYLDESKAADITEWYRYAYFSPKPVMPVHYILSCINKAYGTKFKLSSTKSGNTGTLTSVINNPEQLFEENNLGSFGCLPLVGNDLTDSQLDNYSLHYMAGAGAIWKSDIKCFERKHIITFGYMMNEAQLYGEGKDNYLVYAFIRTNKSYGVPKGAEFEDYASLSNKSTDTTWSCGGFWSPFEVEMQGRIVARTSKELVDDDDDTKLTIKVFSPKKVETKISFLAGSSGDTFSISAVSVEDITTLDPVMGKNVYNAAGKFQYAEYTFNSLESMGYNAWTIGDEQDADKDGRFYFFQFSNEVTTVVEQSSFTCKPLLNDAKKRIHKIDTFTNLPDIDCLSFVKSMYYMMGAFPYVQEDGTIIAKHFSELSDNISLGNVYDWSRKIMSYDELADEISFSSGDFKQNNYYLSKWDDLDRTSADLLEEDDVYEDGVGNINVGNETLDKEQTVHQTPFNTPYLLNRKYPVLDTGGTIKAWDADISDLEDFNTEEDKKILGGVLKIYPEGGYHDPIYDLVSITEAKPAYGYFFLKPTDSQHLGYLPLHMGIVNPFKEMAKNPSYAYLQEIVKNPFVITENFNLNEFDLKDIDYTKPIYINKYNSYFAIITIQRDSKGVCKCELIKLPTPTKDTATE